MADWILHQEQWRGIALFLGGEPSRCSNQHANSNALKVHPVLSPVFWFNFDLSLEVF